MSRDVDRLPTPAHVKPKKLIVMTLQELGFKPYHMAETLRAHPLMKRAVIAGMRAELLHDGKRYTRLEFDKIYADYDIIIEAPFFMPRSFLNAYPDAKYLLIERDPERWAKSFINTIGGFAVRLRRFPASLFKRFDEYASSMSNLNGLLTDYHTNNLGTSDEGRQALIENYVEYIADVKRLVPPEQLTVFKLEDGFGWNELCPYMGVPIPDAPWPNLNTVEEIEAALWPLVQSGLYKGMVASATLVAIAAIGMWYAWQ
ncbi:hypothetical protein GGS21DRAFT_488485 [Xylaria nigripes]|nr:hypothetical protein GGS21DRAFT_488485 [Xylaria nigripes]